MRRRTKIVATLGPATDDVAVLTDMVHAGLDVARVNFSHGQQAEHLRRIELVREAARRAGKIVGILADLGGPKIRIEGFRDGPIRLVEGAPFALDPRLAADAGNPQEVGIAYANLHRDVRPGDTLLLADGQIVLDVQAVEGPRVATVVRLGGELSNRKGLNRQGGGISAPALSDKDRDDIRFAAAHEIDYVAVSFARDAADIREARTRLRPGRSVIRTSIETFMEQLDADERLLHILLREGVVGSDAYRAAVERELRTFEEELCIDLVRLSEAGGRPIHAPALVATAMTRLVFAMGATAIDLPRERRGEVVEQLVEMLRMIMVGAHELAEFEERAGRGERDRR